MSVDNHDFITKYHKTQDKAAEVITASSKHDYVGYLLFMAVMMLYAGLFFGMQQDIYGNIRNLGMFFSGLCFFLIFTYAVFRLYVRHDRTQRRLLLIEEVLEGSRGARLITDASDNAVYHNIRFAAFCEDTGGEPGYQTLVALFKDVPEAESHFRSLADKAHRGLMDSIELLSQSANRERWLMVTAQPVAGWAGYVHWRVDDVTDQHTINRAIREEREKLIDFTDNAPVGFFSVDQNGRFVFVNATFARWLGQDIQSLLNEGSLHTYLADIPANAQPYDVIEGGGARQIAEVRMKGPGGRTILTSINQTVVKEADGGARTRAVVHDLSAEKEMRRALQASEDRFQRFFEEAPLGILLVDRNAVIQDCNSAFSHMVGTSIDDLEGTQFDQLVHTEFRQPVLNSLDRIGEGQQMAAPQEIVLHGKYGPVDVQIHARRFKDSTNTVLHFIDLTEQKKLENQFVQSQKMQAIGQLAGGIAHDFNNLLTAMVGFCDLLLLRHKPGDPSFSDLMQIKQNANRAANLVRQLLAFSRQQTLRPQVQDITDILTELSHLLRRLIGANIDLELVHGDGLSLVKVDGGQMEQVLINLAVNARDAMDGGGTLRVTTEDYQNRKTEKCGGDDMPPGHWVKITVSDSGCGISKENLVRIFEPFFTTKGVGEGTGLGLATVYGIIRQTDGYLHVISKVGEGTQFIIYLPAASEEDSDQAENQAVEHESDVKDLTGTECILLVEDEDAVRTFSQRALANKGYEVLTADSGESALQVIKDNRERHIDLLVTDVVMPTMDGPTLAREMRAMHPKMKIIFMSGYTEDKLKDHMDERTYFLPKPFTLKQLAAKVKDVLDE